MSKHVLLPTLTQLYPYSNCPDDEVRTWLYSHYGAKITAAGIASCPEIAPLRNIDIVIGTSPSHVLDGLDPLIGKTIQEVLKCALPEWMTDENANVPSAATLPLISAHSVKMNSHYNIIARWQSNSTEYGFNLAWKDSDISRSENQGVVNLALHRTASVHTAVIFHCFRQFAKMPLLYPSLLATPAYDCLFEYVWHDVLCDADITLNFRPRWSMYASEHDGKGWPVVIPDVVLSAQIPKSQSGLSPYAMDAHQRHPAYAYNVHSESELLEVPLLLVEYNKTTEGAGIDGSDAHQDHLCASMSATLALYNALGLNNPVFGLYFKSAWAVIIFVGFHDERGKPTIHPIRVSKAIQSILNLRDKVHIFHLYTMLWNLRTVAKGISERLLPSFRNENELEPNEMKHEWSTSKGPKWSEEHRPAIDSVHPPLIEEDLVLRFIFGRSLDNIDGWLKDGKITIVPGPQPTGALPTHAQEWLKLLSPEIRGPATGILDAMIDCKKGMTGRTQRLVDACWNYHRANMIGELSCESEVFIKYMSASLQFSITACSHAQDLQQKVSDVGHSYTTRWQTFYRTFFATAWRCFNEMELRYNPPWAVHGDLRADLISINPLDEIRPDIVFLTSTKSLGRRHVAEWNRLTAAGFDGDRVICDLSPSIDLEAAGLGHLATELPISVTEFVLTHDNAEERAKHLAHLAIVMRTALAVWEMHCVDSATILGLLVDRNKVNVVLGWIDKESKQYMVQEISDSRYIFDITEPYDAFRLFEMLWAQSLEPIQSHVQDLIDAHTDEAMQAISNDLEYQSWKSPKRVPGGFSNMTTWIASSS